MLGRECGVTEKGLGRIRKVKGLKENRAREEL